MTDGIKWFVLLPLILSHPPPFTFLSSTAFSPQDILSNTLAFIKFNPSLVSPQVLKVPSVPWLPSDLVEAPRPEQSLNPAVVKSPILKPIKLPFELSVRRQSTHCVASGIKSTDNLEPFPVVGAVPLWCDQVPFGFPGWDRPHWKEVAERVKEFVERPSCKSACGSQVGDMIEVIILSD
ncbi:hypothetical protein B0H13DRAFT_2363011 [Mycena leptocephala]|nr:hypothetical protein B0H13DRAFT_2368519 [Mycena leptocephala]KAJ7846460.1 hypothetical protein B0H13DRAFT_2363011 [Mycena leptocephala]